MEDRSIEPSSKRRRLDTSTSSSNERFLETLNASSYDPFIEDITPWPFEEQVTTLGEYAIRYIAKHLNLFSGLELLPTELLEKIFDRVSKTHGLTDGNLILFSSLPNLDLARSGITDNGILRITPKANTSLMNLVLDGCNVTDASLMALSKWCTNLTHFSVVDCSSISPEAVANLIGVCTNLTSLNLKGIPLHQCIVEKFANLKSLYKLQISNVSIDVCKVIHKSNVLPTLRELSIQSEFWISRFVQFCSNLQVLDLSHNSEVKDTIVKNIITGARNLSSISLSYLPKLTDDVIQFLIQYESPTLKRVYLLGNRQFNNSSVRSLVLLRKFQVFGGPMKIFILRSRSCLQTIILNVDRYITLQDLLDKCLVLVNREDPFGNWKINELRFRRVAYRKNGTKRPADLYKPPFYNHLIRELLGEKRQYFYLEQKKEGWPMLSLSPPPPQIRVETSLPDRRISEMIFLKLKLWNNDIQSPQDLDDIEVPCKMTLEELKQLICSNYFPQFSPDQLLIVEEETTLRINFLLSNSATLYSYGIISGDILHVEKLSDFHYNEYRHVVRSYIQQYLSSHSIVITIEESSDSFDNRKIYQSHLPTSPIRFELSVKGTTSFNQLKQDIANLCEIDVKYIKLHTKVAPTIVVQGNDESLDDILGGNTWLVVRFDLEAFEKFPPRVDFRTSHTEYPSETT